MKWKKIAGGIAVIVLLAVAFWYGGNTPDSRGFDSGERVVTEQSVDPDVQEADRDSDKLAEDKKQSKTGEHAADTQGKNVNGKSGNLFQQLVMKITQKGSSSSSKKGQSSKKAQRNAQKAVKKAEKQSANTQKTSGKNKEQTPKKSTTEGKTTTNSQNSKDTSEENVDSNKVNSNTTTEQKQPSTTTEEATTELPANMVRCTISISCSTVLDQMKLLKDNKKKIIPKDGIFLGNTTVTVKKGSSVFDVLQKVTKENKIQLEYNYTPAYKNYYIEGIGNLYEFDAGELSGWMYCVNGEFPGYGCSSYTVKDGDEILWVYTCNLGKDVGGYFEE